MTSSAAYEILGLTPKADKKAIKKRYRYLMHHVHPDSGAFKAASGKSYDYRYSAQEINAAYSFLYKNDNFKLQENIKNTGTAKYTEKNTKYSHNNSSDDAASNNSSDFNYSPKNKTIWKAETNPNAYTERNIYHYTQDRLNTRGQNKYKNIDFMIKLLPKPDKYFPENINTRIDELLQNFTKI